MHCNTLIEKYLSFSTAKATTLDKLCNYVFLTFGCYKNTIHVSGSLGQIDLSNYSILKHDHKVSPTNVVFLLLHVEDWLDESIWTVKFFLRKNIAVSLVVEHT